MGVGVLVMVVAVLIYVDASSLDTKYSWSTVDDMDYVSDSRSKEDIFNEDIIKKNNNRRKQNELNEISMWLGVSGGGLLFASWISNKLISQA